MSEPPDLFATLRLLMEAYRKRDELAREGLEHQQAGRLAEARRCLDQAEEIQRGIDALTGK